MIKKLGSICLVIATIFSIASSAPAFAESGDVVVSINPSERDLKLDPGNHYSENVTVYNVGRLAFDFEVSAVPFQVKDDNYSPDFYTQNAYTKLSNWITFPETKFHVEPGAAAEVHFDINVPKDIPGGGQYAAIAIRTIEPGSEGGGVAIMAQLASIIHGHVRGVAMREEGTMVSHSIPHFMLSGTFKLSSVFENTGNVDYRVTETMTIRDYFTGKEAVNIDSSSSEGLPIGITSATVLPGTKRTIDMIWPGAPQLGLFRVNHTIRFLQEDYSFDEVVFLCPVWLLVLVSILVILIIAGLISIFRARKHARPQVF